jgi:hypothetical protein
MPYPPEIAGFVDEPAFVLITGDISDEPENWAEPGGFLEHYGLDGTDGLINYPVYETRGNHDMYPEMTVWITERHGSLYYSFDRDGIHFVCLDVYPTAAIADWLGDDLAGLSNPDTPVILFQHYPVAYSGEIMEVIYGYNILALFHGHEHTSSHLVYNDPQSDAQYDIFSVGSPTKKTSHYFYVVNINDDRMIVVENYCFQPGQWRDHYTKTLVDGDINSDGKVDLEDFAKIALFWNTDETSADIAPLGDVDGVVDILDLAVLCNNWLTGAE